MSHGNWRAVDLRQSVATPPPSQSGKAHVRLAPGSEEKSRDGKTEGALAAAKRMLVVGRCSRDQLAGPLHLDESWCRWPDKLFVTPFSTGRRWPYSNYQVGCWMLDAGKLSSWGGFSSDKTLTKRMADIRRRGMELDAAAAAAAILGLKRQTGNPSTPSRTNRHHPLLVIQHQGGRGLSRRGGGIERGRAAKDGRASIRRCIRKRKEEDSIPGESRHWTPLQDFLPRAIWSTASMASIAIAEAKTVIVCGPRTRPGDRQAQAQAQAQSLSDRQFLSDHGLCGETTPWPCDDLVQEKAVWGLGSLKTPAKRQGNIGKVADSGLESAKRDNGDNEAQSVDGGQSCPGQTKFLSAAVDAGWQAVAIGLGEAPVPPNPLPSLESQLLVKAPSFSWGSSWMDVESSLSVDVVRRDPSSKTPSGQMFRAAHRIIWHVIVSVAASRCELSTSTSIHPPPPPHHPKGQQGHGLSWRPYERASLHDLQYCLSRRETNVTALLALSIKSYPQITASYSSGTLPDGPRDRSVKRREKALEGWDLSIPVAYHGKTGKLELGLEARPFNLRENGTLPCGHYKDEINYNRSAAVSREWTAP
ncbi:uncharacterized protein CLUP02_15860 [Colletotrichum lupini]|uniref:Uncharacterized protein n=1 Tax=Colletotrichum lupini TaxID=145971 RepID=A0A9Q8T7C4_9PEZI|nr:uncharacterized protein CLUP02_15860 [Colletotrichum lupini]UQC90330.1 hypothetical protein CLUP02_15860 [Colletotrichum lupini]